MAGASEFLRGLQTRGCTLYLASGTDHADVVREAGLLGLAEFFAGRIYGALDQVEAQSKEKVIERILAEHGLAGPELLVVGDGPVELRAARRRDALALGIASDERQRRGWNESKLQRLRAAGAELLIPDFIHYAELVQLLVS